MHWYMVNTVNEFHVSRRLQIIEETLENMKTVAPPSTMLATLSDSFVDMINAYTADARHFLKEGDYINAFAAVNYLWGWIDCGKEIGLFVGTGEERKLLTLTDTSTGPSTEITTEKINRYLDITRRAMIKMKDSCPIRTFAISIVGRFSEVIDEMYSSACQLCASQQFRDAFATVNYTHAWIDVAARIGLYDVGGDDQLFTLFS